MSWIGSVRTALFAESIFFVLVGGLPPAFMGCGEPGVKDVDYKEPRTGLMPPLKIIGKSPGTCTVTVNGGSTPGTATGTPTGGGTGGTGTEGSTSSADVTVTTGTTGIHIVFVFSNGSSASKDVLKAEAGL